MIVWAPGGEGLCGRITKDRQKVKVQKDSEKVEDGFILMEMCFTKLLSIGQR